MAFKASQLLRCFSGIYRAERKPCFTRGLLFFSSQLMLQVPFYNAAISGYITLVSLSIAMQKFFLISILILGLSGCQTTPTKPINSDEAIRRVENCTCYTSAEGQKIKPWELAWDDSEKLRKQFSDCICETHIDLKNVENPKRYVMPGTIVK